MKAYQVILDITKNDEALENHEDLNATRDENVPTLWVIETFNTYEAAKKYIAKLEKLWVDEKLTVVDHCASTGEMVYPPECYSIKEIKIK